MALLCHNELKVKYGGQWRGGEQSIFYYCYIHIYINKIGILVHESQRIDRGSMCYSLGEWDKFNCHRGKYHILSMFLFQSCTSCIKIHSIKLCHECINTSIIVNGMQLVMLILISSCGLVIKSHSFMHIHLFIHALISTLHNLIPVSRRGPKQLGRSCVAFICDPW